MPPTNKNHRSLTGRRCRLHYCAVSLVFAALVLFQFESATWQPYFDVDDNQHSTAVSNTKQVVSVGDHANQAQEQQSKTQHKVTIARKVPKRSKAMQQQDVWFLDTTDNDAALKREQDDKDDVIKFAAYIHTRQHPKKCRASRVWTWTHQAGIGSVLQVWKNTLLKALNDNKVLASGFESEYLNPLDCPSRRPEDCLVFPISNCVAGNTTNITMVPILHTEPPRTKPRHNENGKIKPVKTEREIITDVSTGFRQIQSRSCTIPNGEMFYKRAKLSKIRSNQWYHAQVMRYILRTRPIVDVYKAAVSNALNLPPPAQLLAVHIRHGDIGLDGRVPIPTTHYVHVAVQQAVWAGFTDILVGSDNQRAARELRLLVLDDPILQRVCPSMKVHTFPNELFELTNDGGKVATELHLKRAKDEYESQRREHSDDEDEYPDADSDTQNVSSIIADYIEQHVDDIETIFARVKQPVNLDAMMHKNEGAAMLAQLMLMSDAGGFIGTINSNYARTVYDLVLARKDGAVYLDVDQGAMAVEDTLLYDMEGRPYFGCYYKKNMPAGGGGEMYPYNSDKIK